MTVNFKFGGISIPSRGDQAVFEINKRELSSDGINIKITKEGDKKPYLRAEIMEMKSAGDFLPRIPQ